MKKYIVCAICICVLLLLGCETSDMTGILSGYPSSQNYDYRKMYLENDYRDLTDKDLEIFKIASNVYRLYIENCETKYDSVLAAHDYILENCVYNSEGLENNNLTEDDFSAYGVFVRGKAVCEGYAKAYKMLMDIAGIDCIIVTGNVGEDNTAHAWNMVKIDDDWYHVDVTYDDPEDGRGIKTTEKVYLYFCVTDETISKDHIWNEKMAPRASSDKYDYVKENYAHYNTEEEIKEILNNCSVSKTTYVSFIWEGQEEISDIIWRKNLKGTDITNLTFSLVGTTGRRMYMLTLSY